MTEFEKQFHEVQELLEFNDFNQTIKRVIDFTLDSENIEFYSKKRKREQLDIYSRPECQQTLDRNQLP